MSCNAHPMGAAVGATRVAVLCAVLGALGNVGLAHATEAEPPEAATKERWYQAVQLGAFVDGYANMNWNLPRPNVGANIGRANDLSSGLALHWVGLDASYAPAPVGGTVQLRFGPGVQTLYAFDEEYNLSNVKQAFGSWKPGGKDSALTLSFGKFDHPFGSEEIDSQLNMNYSHSFLYFYSQPAAQTGFTVEYQWTADLRTRLFVVNGWDRVVDNNRGKTLGAHVQWVPSKAVTLYAGYSGGPEKSDTCPAGTGLDARNVCSPTGTLGTRVPGSSDLRHFADLIADVDLSRVRLLGNISYGMEKNAGAPDSRWYGANVISGITLSREFSAALRVSYYRDEGFSAGLLPPNVDLFDGTATLGYSPNSHLILRLESRYDSASKPIFPSATGHVNQQITSTLGVIVTTN